MNEKMNKEFNALTEDKQKIREYKKQIARKERKLARAKKLLEKWLFFNGFDSALKKETEDFLGKKTEEIGMPEDIKECTVMKSKNS